uniref:N-acetyltransferase domain-containing protein n=1 Tax=Globisporangium ultimum (strain ATCC 200006 / CBS 805.95 / DAOM BR144) TaxID=431595 RepID=K3XAQ4_GLOUD
MAPIAQDADSPPTIELHQYLPQDRAAVVELFRDGMMHYTNEGDPQYSVWENYVKSSMESDLADIEGVYLSNGGNFWVALATSSDDDQKIVRTLAIEKKQLGGVGELMRVSVHSAFHRFGIGRLLLHHGETWARTNKFEKLILSNAKTMAPAHRFYTSLGYTHTKTTVFSHDPFFELTHFEKQLLQP